MPPRQPPTPNPPIQPTPAAHSATPRKLLFIAITGGATALYATFATAAYSAALADDMMTAVAALFLAWLAGVCALALSEALGALTIKKRLGLNIAFSMVLALVTFALGRYFYSKRPSPSVPTALLAEQIQELKNIEDFIGSKSESELHHDFDYPDIVKFNLVLLKRSLDPPSVSAQELSDVDAFFKGGNQHIDVRYGRPQQIESGIAITHPPGVIWRLWFSQKHQQAIDKIQHYERAAFLPETVRDALRTFDATVQNDDALMFEIFNNQLRENPQNLLHEGDPNSVGGRMSGPYWRAFIPLSPKADVLNAAIQVYLKTEGHS